MYFTYSYLIPNFLCDRNDTLTMWGVARLFQEVAGFHVDAANMGFSTLISQGKAWVLCRAHYQVEKLPHEGEHIMLKTWSRGTDGLYAFREFQMYDQQGNILVASTANWAIIDYNARHVVRLQDMMDHFESHPEFATDCQKLGRLRLPKEASFAPPVAQFSVKPSMLDHTGHVNNAEYIKWIFDNLPHTDFLSAPFCFNIEYLMETQLTETVTLSHCQLPECANVACSSSAAPRRVSTYFQITNPRSVAVIANLIK